MSEERSWIQFVSFLLPPRLLQRFHRTGPVVETAIDSNHMGIPLDSHCQIVWGPRDVLVGSLKNRGQLDVCLTHHFYHIPMAIFGKQDVNFRYVSLYQSKNLFGEASGIQYYGEISGCQIVKRFEITEIPSERDALYYRFEIKDWKKLPRKIKVKETAGTLTATNLFLLENSVEVPQLNLQAFDEFQLYNFLLKHKDKSSFSFRDTTIIIRKDKIFVTVKNEVVLQLPYMEFQRKPGWVIHRIIKSAHS